MAIGLSQVNKKKAKVTKGQDAKKVRSKAARRPWRGLSENQALRTSSENSHSLHEAATAAPRMTEILSNDSDLAFDPLANLNVPLNLKFAFNDIEGASHWDLMVDLVSTRWSSSIHDLIKKSYWLSRVTHRRSWLSRLQIYPRIKIPLPSLFTQHSEKK